VGFVALHDRIPGLIVKGAVAAAVSGGFMIAAFRKDLLALVKRLKFREGNSHV